MVKVLDFNAVSNQLQFHDLRGDGSSEPVAHLQRMRAPPYGSAFVSGHRSKWAYLSTVIHGIVTFAIDHLLKRLD
jgi:hypothetical protein